MFLFDSDIWLQVVGKGSLVLSAMLVLILLAVHMKERGTAINEYVGRLPAAARWSVYAAAFWAIVISGVFGVRQEFIYFQF
jgi:hypothetical protein